MSQKDSEQTSDQVTGETTSAFRADLLGELDAAAAAAAEAGVWGVDGLPSGSAVVVVKCGPNAAVSRRHAEFRLENGEFWVVDIGSLNGTYLNRKPVQSAVLANGDEIQIGKYRLVFLTRPTTG